MRQTPLPTLLAKILGFYTLAIKRPNGRSSRKTVLVMENLFYLKNINQVHLLLLLLRYAWGFH